MQNLLDNPLLILTFVLILFVIVAVIVVVVRLVTRAARGGSSPRGQRGDGSAR